MAWTKGWLRVSLSSRFLAVFCLVIVTLLATAVLGAQARLLPAPATPFSDSIRARFKQWDTNKDGLINASEAQMLLKDGNLTEKESAAVAVMAAFVLKPGSSQKFSLGFLSDYERRVKNGLCLQTDELFSKVVD